MNSTAHALLRDRRTWRCAMTGLAISEPADGDGDLVLAQVPRPGNGRDVLVPGPLPYTRDVSGIALGPCNAVFVADTAHDQVIYIDGLCGSQTALPANPAAWAGAPGHFRTPRGLACGGDALLVADSGNGRVQHLAWPHLEASLAWTTWADPVSLAVDNAQRVLVIDASDGTLHRVHAHGGGDAAFDTAVAGAGKLAQPRFVATDQSRHVMVSDSQQDEVFVFDHNGAFVQTLPGPALWMPGALATFGARVYVADAARGSICVFEQSAASVQLIGTVAGWQGPVTALAVAADGTLYIKPDLGSAFYTFVADGAYVAQGTLVAGPFDAGENCSWERAFADTVLPANTGVTFEVAVAAAALPPPGPGAWVPLPAYDALLALFTTNARRFAWLRLTLASADGTATPRVQQARLATAAEDYLDYLPLTYRYNDGGANGFLSRWLRLMRSEFGRIEASLNDMPRVADPRFEQSGYLGWLAQWFGLELPQIADDNQRRALIGRAVQLMTRRGTRQSIVEFARLHTGIAPAIVEAFTDRRLWILGRNSRLDFDTRLPTLDPLGMVLPDPAVEAGCCPTSALPPSPQACSPCRVAATATTAATAPATPVMSVGRAVVGEGGPLATYQIGLPLFSEEAYRFCVVVDQYRVSDPQTLQELARIVDREKPAHTDYRINVVAPDMRVGLQALIGIDTVVGGEAAPLHLGSAALNVSANLSPANVARIGAATLDGGLTLT